MSHHAFIRSSKKPVEKNRNRMLFLGSVTGLTLGAAEGAFPKDTDPIQLPTLSVEGQNSTDPVGDYKADSSSLGKLTAPLLDTPQTVTVVTQKSLEDRGITTMRDALRTVPGISINAGESGAQGDNLSIRGFSAQGNFFMDGMRDGGSYYRDPFNLNQLEVLKGPASILFGRGSTGGVIEQDSKAARLDSITAGSVAFGTDMTKRVTVDVNREVSTLGEGAALRINAMANDNAVTDRDAAQYSRFGLAPTLALGLGSPTRVTISYFHQQEFDIPDYGVPWLYQAATGSGSALSQPASLSITQSKFYGLAHSDYLRTSVDIPTVKVEHDFSDDFSVKNQTRYAHYSRNYRITEPQIGTVTGNTLISPSTNQSTFSVTRNRIAGYSTETFLQNQTDLTWRFETGPLAHTVVSGLEIGRETSNPVRRTTTTPYSVTSLANPSYDQTDDVNSYVSTRNVSSAYSHAFYVLDTMKFGQSWELMAGMRFDHYDTKLDATTYATTGAISARFQGHHVDEIPSWRGALIYKPADNGSVYFAAGTSFNPSAETLTATSANAILAPVENISKELGTKWDVLNRGLALSAAAFETEQLNVRETDPNNSAVQILAGDAIARGAEVNAVGHLTPQWEFNAGYAYTFSSIIKSPSTSISSDLGHRLANTPLHSGSVWSIYTLPSKLELGGGITYVGSRFASATPTTVGGVAFWKWAPEYWTLNLVAKYPLSDQITAQININNLTDERFYDQISGGHVIPGAGRTGLLTVGIKF